MSLTSICTNDVKNVPMGIERKEEEDFFWFASFNDLGNWDDAASCRACDLILECYADSSVVNIFR